MDTSGSLSANAAIVFPAYSSGVGIISGFMYRVCTSSLSWSSVPIGRDHAPLCALSVSDSYIRSWYRQRIYFPLSCMQDTLCPACFCPLYGKPWHHRNQRTSCYSLISVSVFKGDLYYFFFRYQNEYKIYFHSAIAMYMYGSGSAEQ